MVHGHLVTNKGESGSAPVPGRGVQTVSDRCKDSRIRFGSAAEQYNGHEEGRHFKWYSRQMFLAHLRQLGASEASCSERQCMEALVATNAVVAKNEQKSVHLTPYAGPQCFARLNPGSFSYRVNANQLRRREKSDEKPVPDAFHHDSWHQCCSCGKWRFVDEDTARLLQDETLFDQRDSDLDWSRWLSDAGDRYSD